MFPQKTYKKMLNLVNYALNSGVKFCRKFAEIDNIKDVDKKNRWFGYYQKVGEDIGLWTLEEVRKDAA